MKKMWNIRILVYLSSFFLIFLSFSSCKKWIDPEINENPNQPTDVPLKLMLPGAEGGLAYATGGDVARYTGMFTQHFAGVNYNQWNLIDRYGITETDVDNVWNTELYAGAMKDFHEMINQAKKENAPYYEGIGKILMAYSIGMVTDMWGNVPYSEAFKNGENRTPKYDSQQDIYNVIQQLLSEAIGNLSATSSSNISKPGTDDMIYGGNTSKWIKTAYALSARYWIHLTKINSSAAANALTALTNSYTSNSEDCEFPFYNNSTQSNPWYQINLGPAKLLLGKRFVDLLKDTINDTVKDPRLTIFAKVTGSGKYVGAEAGSGSSNASRLGTFYGSIDSKVPLITYVETKFIEAEAALRTGDSAKAATAYNNGIKASLSKYGVSDANFENTYASETTGSITLEKIMTQKYIALFTQPEAFTDWRRTGYPSLSAAMNDLNGGTIPKRLPYPQSEKLYNGSNVPYVTLSTKVWWDL